MKNTVKITFWIMLTAAVVLGINAGWDKYQEFRQAELARVMTVKDKKFDPGQLTEMAAALAAKPYVPPADNLPDELKKLNYDQYRDIRFSRENGPWYGKNCRLKFSFPPRLIVSHLGSDQRNRQRPHSSAQIFPRLFRLRQNRLNTDELSELGYAGFRLHNPLNTRKYYDELVSFLGASYFRALGKHQKYGLSARGLAIDTAVQTGEEFPIFREFWLVRPKRNDKSVTVYALLDSPSAAGIYTFVITPGENTVMDVDAKIFPRKEINKLGIAPLTSMYLFGENTKTNLTTTGRKCTTATVCWS